MRKSSAASHPVGRRQFLTLSAAGLAAAGLPRAARAQGKRSGELVGRALRAHADARPGQSLLDLRHLGAPAHVRSAGGRHQRLEVRARPGRVLARGQQHHLALHAPERRQLPRRHPVQRGQRALHAAAGEGQHQAHQVLRVPGHRIGGEGRRLRGDRDLQAAVRLAARPPHHARHAAGARGQERGGVLPEADRHRAVPLRVVDARRPHRALGQPELLEARPAAGREGHVPLHPRAVHAGGGAARGRDPRGRPRHPRPGRDAQGQPRREGVRRARGRGPALDLPARQGAGEGRSGSGRRSRSPSTGT